MTTDSMTAEPSGFFDGWSLRRKLSLGVGVALILAIVLFLAWWVQRAPKAVLFADMSERDAGVIAAELDKLKQPYSFSEDGRAILMPADIVHRTRLALMGKSLPLHGAVGFELFNNADFGVSDFVQKVNYQRALQGELTRTILALEEVQDARVHLALPDQALFRKEGPKAKASVTVSLKGGRTLKAEQVMGIQRLIAASVPEIKPEDVTVLDQQGVVLSRASGDESTASMGQLDARQGLEAHLARKATRLLDQMFSAGEAMVAVDVVLNHDQSKVTTEEVLAAPQADRSGHPAGVVTRERSVTKEPTAGASAGTDASSAQVVTQETDYAAGRRVAQTVSQGGQIAQLNVAVVVRRDLSEAELQRVRQLVATAVGLQPARGDLVTVHSMASLRGAAVTVGASAPRAELPVDLGAAGDRVVQQKPPQPASALVAAVLAALVLLVIFLAVAAVSARRRARPSPSQAALTEQERQAVLASLKRWLEPQP